MSPPDPSSSCQSKHLDSVLSLVNVACGGYGDGERDQIMRYDMHATCKQEDALSSRNSPWMNHASADDKCNVIVPGKVFSESTMIFKASERTALSESGDLEIMDRAKVSSAKCPLSVLREENSEAGTSQQGASLGTGGLEVRHHTGESPSRLLPSSHEGSEIEALQRGASLETGRIQIQDAVKRSSKKSLRCLTPHANSVRRSPRLATSGDGREDIESVSSAHSGKTSNGRNTNGFLLKTDVSVSGLHTRKSLKLSLFHASDGKNGFTSPTEVADRSDKKHPHNTNLSSIEMSTTLHESSANHSAVAVAVAWEADDKNLAFNSVSSKAVEEEGPNKFSRWDSSENRRKSSFFIGDPIPVEEAQEKWRWRYEMKGCTPKKRIWELDDDEDMIISNVKCHYSKAKVNGKVFSIGDCAYIRGDGTQKLIGKIIEFFQTTDNEDYFRVQWFYKAEDTIIQQAATFHDRKRLFYSTVRNDNPLECIISKIKVSQVSLGVASKSKPKKCDFYFDMEYCVEYSTFRTFRNASCSETRKSASAGKLYKSGAEQESRKRELVLLDLYSGCGGMSTGLCFGAKVSGVNLVTRWAIDMDRAACESFKFNHPEAHVRADAAEDFLALLREWQKLCKRYLFNDSIKTEQPQTLASSEHVVEDSSSSDDDVKPGVFEVANLVDICYGDPARTGKSGLKFKVHWKGYGPSEDSWEPVEGLRDCQESIREFVRYGFNAKILPLPGDIDVICGGPPCQGISGYNRYRNVDSPLDDERNRQIVVFSDIVEYLKPRFVLMENVVDILRFDRGSLARYALSRLIHIKYQARLGIMAAGCYGLPQFRLRIFLWGAHANEKLPQFPLPTHDVIVRYWSPPEFERNVVAYDEGQPRELEKAIVLGDAISDLPPVTNDEEEDEMPYKTTPVTELQTYLRCNKYEMTGSESNDQESERPLLYDHRAYKLSEDDYLRVCRIPKRKGANFRDFPGLIVGADGVARRGPAKEQVKLPSGKSLVPEYVFTFEQGKSKRPFGRLWWDETVSTVLTFPTCHNQSALHPEQDRILTVREYARLQGFPDYYRFRGTVKERYCQVGNAVAVSVSRALGYALGKAYLNLAEDEPLFKLPPKFTHSNHLQLMQLEKEAK